jgi:hypothetical protein
MNYNKNYFTVYNTGVIVNDGTGLVINNMSVRYILGYLYDRYTAFTIKLEGFVSRLAASTAIEDDFLLMHLEGFNFMNGFDTCQLYGNSRVLEMIDFSTVSNRGYNFISYCNGVNFRKPSTDRINFKMYFTRLTNESRLINADDASFIFSITGIESYRIKNPEKYPLIPRLSTIQTSNLTLSTRNAISIDSRNRAFLFKNVNLRNIIGSDYDKYSKFALITRAYGLSEYNGNLYYGAFSGFAHSNIMISGFNFICPSLAQYVARGTITEQNEISAIHPTPSCISCQVVYGTGNPTSYKETYVENAFEKSSDIIDTAISNTQVYSYTLVPVNTGNSQLFPHYTFQFDIIPLILD